MAFNVGDAMYFFRFFIAYIQQTVVKLFWLAAGSSSPLQFLFRFLSFFFLSMSLRNNNNCHLSHERSQKKGTDLLILWQCLFSFRVSEIMFMYFLYFSNLLLRSCPPHCFIYLKCTSLSSFSFLLQASFHKLVSFT